MTLGDRLDTMARKIKLHRPLVGYYSCIIITARLRGVLVYLHTSMYFRKYDSATHDATADAGGLDIIESVPLGPGWCGATRAANHRII